MEKLKLLKNVFKGDKVIWSIFFTLCIISVVEVYSSSASLGYKSGNYWNAPIYHSFLLFIGMLGTIFTSYIPCRYFKVIGTIGILVSFFLLFFVLFFGTKTNDAARWVNIFGIPLQPSEIAKGSLIIMTAKILATSQTDEGVGKEAFKAILIITVPILLLILPENFSTAFLLGMVIFLMMFIGRVEIKFLAWILTVVIGLGLMAFVTIMSVGKAPATDIPLTENIQHSDEEEYNNQEVHEKRKGLFHRFDLWRQRINDFGNNEETSAQDYDIDKNRQVGNAKIAIASSNFIGVGPGNSTQRDFLPLAFSDFIYAIIYEEMGWIGGALVTFLYISLAFRVGMIARKCVNPFPTFLALGFAMLITIQALFNMLVAVGALPVTGQPLPLISKGGTSSILNCIYIGIILSVSRTAKKQINVHASSKNSVRSNSRNTLI